MTANLGRSALGSIYRAQAPAIAALTKIDATTTVITKQLLKSIECNRVLRLRLRPCIESSYTPHSIHPPTQDTLVSSVVMSYAGYYFPLGKISLSYGWGSQKPDEHGANEELSLAGWWGFNPAPWVSYRNVSVQVRLLVRFGELSKPRITPSLTVRVCMSEDHPVWESIGNGDLMGIQRHLSSGSIGINDATLWGTTLLNAVGNRLLFQAHCYRFCLQWGGI